MAGDDARPDLPALKPRLLIRLERKRRTIFNVTHHAVLVENAHDLTVEQNGRGEGFVGERANAKHQDRGGDEHY